MRQNETILGVIIPVHNRKGFTRDCLASLREQSRPANFVIIVDDGSTDGTYEMLMLEFPDVIVIRGDGNLFWTAAINLGIKKALDMDADFIMTLNNDTVASYNFIENMLNSADQNPLALLGALDLDIKSRVPYYGGEIFNWSTGTSKYLLDTLRKENQMGLHEVSLFPARGLLIPERVFKKIGLFEERYLPHYMADYDFTQRARAYGFPIYCNYDAKLFTYPEEGGDHKIRKQKTLRNYYNHLFSIRGGGNLKNFTIYTLRNCPSEEIVMALIVGYFRRLSGFWLK